MKHVTGEEIIALLEKTYADFCECEGGEGWLKIDGKEYSTDAGYAIDGMRIFMEVFSIRLAEGGNKMTNGDVIKEAFPNSEIKRGFCGLDGIPLVCLCRNTNPKIYEAFFAEEWWNAPYKEREVQE